MMPVPSMAVPGAVDLAALPPRARDAAIMDVCDRAIAQLGEARTIEEVKRVGDLAAAFAAYTRKIKAAIEAQNGAALVVSLAEARIGAELAAAQQRGEVAQRGDNPNVRASDNQTSTLSDLGIPRQRAAEMKKLADLGPDNIREVADAATAAEVPVSRTLMLAAHDAVGAHVAAARDAGHAVTERGIKAAIREAVAPMLAPRPPRAERAAPPSADTRLTDEWSDMIAAVEAIADLDADLADLWRRTPPALHAHVRDEAARALPRLRRWCEILEVADDAQ